MAEPERCSATGKIAYRNPQRAWKAALRINRRPRRVDTKVGHSDKAYHCPHCHLWHLN